MENVIGDKLEDFFSKSKKITYKKGEIILRAGEPVFGVFYIKKGFVRQYLISEEGEEVTITIFRPPAFFPFMLIMTKTPNRYYFEASTDVEVYRQSPELVEKFINQNPDILFDLTSRFAHAMIGLSKRIETLAIGSVYAKVVSVLSYLANQFGEEKDGYTIINLPVTHQDLAAWTGAKRETVSRQIEKLTGDGIIEQQKHLIVVKDKLRLESELNQYHQIED